jgi:hypothetical protein
VHIINHRQKPRLQANPAKIPVQLASRPPAHERTQGQAAAAKAPTAPSSTQREDRPEGNYGDYAKSFIDGYPHSSSDPSFSRSLIRYSALYFIE